MYAIAEQVQSWLAEGREVRLAQVIETAGFSSRDHAAALAWTPGLAPVGSLLDGLSPDVVIGTDLPAYLHLSISDDEAVQVGLSCGGTAGVLVTSAAHYPAQVWAMLAAREPVCLTTVVSGDTIGPTQMFTSQTIRDAFAFAAEIPQLFGRGTSVTAVIDDAGAMRAVVSLWPLTQLVVVGDGLIATALSDVGVLLGWSVAVVSDVDTAVDAVSTLQRSDALVVLSHDRAVDGPVLQAALDSQAGYLGALGSRRTQSARRSWLISRGVSESRIDTVHGPAGLDIDAHTPAEIAISIVAEILATRGASAGGALRDRPGPVHVAGVQAPPPRYPA